MLNLIKMLSIEHDHELFQFLCVPPQQQDMPPQTGVISLVPEAEPTKPKSSRKRKSPLAGSDIVQDHESPEDYEKRINHRDVERQRRKEMASLNSSLRSLVPDEYLQRKSISNDMHGAVNYIKHLKGKVDGLMNKRNELQNLINAECSTGSCNGTQFSVNHDKTSVTVQSSTTGMQFILKTSSVKGLPLSKFLRALNGEGMAVISCTSTRVNEGQIHVIESEMDEGRSIDQTKLQKRLRDLVYNL